MDYKNPKPTVDIIIRSMAHPRTVTLIKRKNPPHGWALPGGFVDDGEYLGDAARREALEETSAVVELQVQLGTYSAPSRDPRQHTITTVYVANVFEDMKAADDAAELIVVDIDAALQMDLAFDHAKILQDYKSYITYGMRPALP